MKRKNLKIGFLVLVLTCSSACMFGCKGAKVEEQKVVVEVDTSKKDNEKTTTEKDSKETSIIDESTVTTKDEETSIEESTTPMETEDGSEEVSKETEKDTTTEKNPTTPTQSQQQTTPQQTTTQQTTTQATTTTQTTTSPVVKPTEPTTSAQNYGAVINKLGYPANTYSRRGFEEDGIYTTAENILKNILTTNMTEVERVRAIHDYLVKNVVYDDATAASIGNGNIYAEVPALTAYGALVNGLAVCEGYSEAFLLLCWTAGIEARLVEGTGNGGGHEWNIVKIEGQWYQIDVTWGDPKFNGVHPPKGSTENLQYDYFLLTTSDMISKGHTISNYYNSEVVSCTSTNYYEYAKQCTFEVKLGGVPYVIVNNEEQVRSAVKSFNINATKKFALIFPEGTLVANDMFQLAADETRNNSSYYGKVNRVYTSGSYFDNIGYTITIIELSFDFV